VKKQLKDEYAIKAKIHLARAEKAQQQRDKIFESIEKSMQLQSSIILLYAAEKGIDISTLVDLNQNKN